MGFLTVLQNTFAGGMPPVGMAFDLPEAFNDSNFGFVDYVDEKGESRPMCMMTRDGFALMVMDAQLEAGAKRLGRRDLWPIRQVLFDAIGANAAAIESSKRLMDVAQQVLMQQM